MRLAGARRMHLQVRERAAAALPMTTGMHLRERRAGVAAFGERARAAEQQQPAAAHVDELRDHPQLVGGERARLDAAEHEAAIGEQLLARLREAGGELDAGRVDVEAQVLVLGGALQRDQLEVLVVLDRLPRELHLEARLPFVIEDALLAIADVDLHVALVVLRDDFARLRRHLQAEDARARPRSR